MTIMCPSSSSDFNGAIQMDNVPKVHVFCCLFLNLSVGMKDYGTISLDIWFVSTLTVQQHLL